MSQVINNNNREDFILLGFPKCGQNDISHCFGCDKHEIAWWSNGLEVYEEKHKGKRPIFTIRNPIDRCWSEYWYFGEFHEHMEYEEFLTHVPTDTAFGLLDAIDRCDYFKYIKRWEKYCPLVLGIDQIARYSSIPIRNAKGGKPKMSDTYFQLTLKLLLERKIQTMIW